MNKARLTLLLLTLTALLVTGCSLRNAARTVAESPSVPGAIAALVLQVIAEGSPPTYDVISDSIVDCVDAYQDSSPATSDLMIHFGDNLECVCWHDWVKRITYERPGYEPNPLFRDSFCPAPEPSVAVTQALEAPPPLQVTTTVEPPVVDPECAAEYGEDHWYCQPVPPEWVK